MESAPGQERIGTFLKTLHSGDLSRHSTRQSQQSAAEGSLKFRILDVLDREGAQPISSLSEELQTEPSDVEQLLQRLEAARFVTTIIDDESGQRIALTPEGQEAAHRLAMRS